MIKLMRKIRRKSKRLYIYAKLNCFLHVKQLFYMTLIINLIKLKFVCTVKISMTIYETTFQYSQNTTHTRILKYKQNIQYH